MSSRGMIGKLLTLLRVLFVKGAGASAGARTLFATLQGFFSRGTSFMCLTASVRTVQLVLVFLLDTVRLGFPGELFTCFAERTRSDLATGGPIGDILFTRDPSATENQATC